MKMLIVPAAALLLVGLAQAVRIQPPARGRGLELAALEQKMHGGWKGQTTCDGRLVFRSDGTYELTEYGPANDDRKGTWKVRWDSLPATLVLTCKTSEVPDEIGKTTEVKLIKLNDRSLAIEYANQNGSPSGHYTRVGGEARKRGRKQLAIPRPDGREVAPGSRCHDERLWGLDHAQPIRRRSGSG